MRFSAYNLGCKVNQVEIESLCSDLVERGYEYMPAGQRSDFAVVNTCTVTKKADSKSFSLIRNLASQSEYLRYVFITGCYSELEKGLKERLADFPVKTRIVRQRDKGDLASIIEKTLAREYGFSEQYSEGDDFAANYQSRWQAFKESRNYSSGLLSQQDVFFMHTRAFLKIQDGCKAFCSYCRIPYARGAPVSRSFNDIMSQVAGLLEKGISEITLCGINIGVYFDRKAGKNFSALVSEILNVLSGKTQLRISSIEPQSIHDDFLDLLAHKSFVPHIHLPLQSPSNRILKRMRRRYSRERFQELLDCFFQAKKNFTVTSDVITGYPSETDDEFHDGYRFIENSGLAALHVFPFSRRPLSDEAEILPENGYQVSDIEKKERAKSLRSLSSRLQQRHAEKLRHVKQRFIVEEILSTPLEPALHSVCSESRTVEMKKKPVNQKNTAGNIASNSNSSSSFSSSRPSWLFHLAAKREKQGYQGDDTDFLYCKGITNYYQHGTLILPAETKVQNGDVFPVFIQENG